MSFSTFISRPRAHSIDAKISSKYVRQTSRFNMVRPVFILFGAAIACIVVGGAMSWLWHPIFHNILKVQLQLTETSRSFNLWKETPIPMFIEFHLFNCTNPGEVINEHAKPELVELGPYVFSEEHSKVNITWNENATISFNQIRRWHFLPEKSNGSLDDIVVNLNVMSLAVAHMASKIGSSLVINLVLDKDGRIWSNNTVGDLLFNGCEDKILDLLNHYEPLTHIHIPFDKFGWFYMRNESWSYDGNFTMDTGLPLLEKLGKMDSWNNFTEVPYYDSYCAEVNGTAGELWPPYEEGEQITMFVSDLCRSLTLDYEEEISVHGLTGRKYVAGRKVIASPDENPENGCFWRGNSFPSGIIDVSECKNGAPAYISYPNFYLADKFYPEKVVGMKPRKDLHEFQITLEPLTGVPLDVAASLQINLHLQPFEDIHLYKDVPDLFMPMLWFTQRARITEDLATELKVPVLALIVGTGTFFGILGLGLFLALIGALIVLRQNWKGAEGDAPLLRND